MAERIIGEIILEDQLFPAVGTGWRFVEVEVGTKWVRVREWHKDPALQKHRKFKRIKKSDWILISEINRKDGEPNFRPIHEWDQR